MPGLATHGATRGRGVSAVEKFEVVHQRLRQLEADRNATSAPFFEHLDLPWPLSVGIVSAGDWASTVPDLLVAEGRYGVRIDETVEEAVRAFEAAVQEATDADPWLRSHPVRVSWPGGMFAPAALPTGHHLLERVGDAVTDVTGRRPPAVGGPYGSDLRHYAAAGVPMVQYGPGEARHAHAVDEHVLLADVFSCARCTPSWGCAPAGPTRGLSTWSSCLPRVSDGPAITEERRWPRAFARGHRRGSCCGRT